ncbi:hypothetical protein MAR_011220 [Mya arenaria]|uniref:Uncharacterized protein n=1 Tax=Mya arenaria TaxID=6604 RepID=A0ABY7FXF1_MYAAR|nr:hypothetical protein MAR_011220 [Mya arenaria]
MTLDPTTAFSRGIREETSETTPRSKSCEHVPLFASLKAPKPLVCRNRSWRLPESAEETVERKRKNRKQEAALPGDAGPLLPSLVDETRARGFCSVYSFTHLETPPKRFPSMLLKKEETPPRVAHRLAKMNTVEPF